MSDGSQAIGKIIAHRGVQEILHFTKGSSGLTGILHVRAVQSRQRLERDHRLAYIFEPNAKFRKDKAWLDYVNLSISEINSTFFAASGNWHKEKGKWWVILAFDPIIAEHPGVYFTTTNNFYSGVRRDQGATGLQALFVDRISTWQNNTVLRGKNMPSHLTTCEQAEVLYPGEISTSYLRRIYVRDGEDQDDTMAQLETLGHNEIEVVLAPERFFGRPQ